MTVIAKIQSKHTHLGLVGVHIEGTEVQVMQISARLQVEVAIFHVLTT